MFHRKWLVRVHLKSGLTIKMVCSDFRWKQASDNQLVHMKCTNSTAWDYIRLSEVEAITSRRCWLSWGWG